MKNIFLLIFLIMSFIAQIVWGQIPHTISYQGILNDNEGYVVPDGNYELKFRIYDDSTGSNMLWEETHSAVWVSNGIFNVILGSVETLGLEFNEPYWLGITIDSEPEMSDLIELTSSAYSFYTKKANDSDHLAGFNAEHYLNIDSVSSEQGIYVQNPEGPITTIGIQENAINSEKIEDGTLTIDDLNFIPVTNPQNGSFAVNSSSSTEDAITGNASSSFSGVAGNNAGTGPGVYGESYSANSEIGAVTGKAKADGGSGVYGQTWSLGKPGGSSCAVYGWAPQNGASVGGAALGVLGRVNSFQGDNASVPCGVFGWATATTGINAGVWGETNSSTGFGVYSAGDLAVNGDFYCNGQKNAVIETSIGYVSVSCIESPEVWFEDFGEGELANGKSHIELDPLFLETVIINNQYPMKVFVQLNDDCKGVYVVKGLEAFDVIENDNGSSNAKFSYRIIAKRKKYENKRFEPFKVNLSKIADQ